MRCLFVRSIHSRLSVSIQRYAREDLRLSQSVDVGGRNFADQRIDFPAHNARTKYTQRTAPGHTTCSTLLLGFEHHARSLPLFLVLGKPLRFLSRCTLLKLAASEVPL